MICYIRYLILYTRDLVLYSAFNCLIQRNYSKILIYCYLYTENELIVATYF